MHIRDLNEETLYSKLHLMLTNPKYEENIKVTSKAFQDQKEKPLERAIWWIEWAIRNPKVTHFKSNAQHLNFIQIESIDVYAFLTLVVTALVWTLLWVFYKILRCIVASKKPISGTKKRN